MALFVRFVRLLSFVFYFLKELILSSLFLAWDILTPKSHLKPGIVEVPIELKRDISLIAFANLISMTPGSLTLDMSQDKSKIYIHVLYLEDKGGFIKKIKGEFEKRIQLIFED